jgi:hypothetical protein
MVCATSATAGVGRDGSAVPPVEQADWAGAYAKAVKGNIPVKPTVV